MDWLIILYINLNSMSKTKEKQPNLPSKKPGKKSGGGRGNNPPKSPKPKTN